MQRCSRLPPRANGRRLGGTDWLAGWLAGRWGQFSSYSGGGYVHDINLDAFNFTTALARLRSLQADK